MPQARGDGATFHVADPDGRWSSVSLWYHLSPPYPDRTFRRDGDGWVCTLARPEVDRLEYLLELTDAAGRTWLSPDESNPVRAPGPFGDRSVVEFPGYRPPSWLSAPAEPGRWRDLLLPYASGLRRPLPLRLWAPASLADDAPAPLLLAHDGPELDRYASLTQYSASLVLAGRLPPHRVGLLQPLDRDAWYSASPAYARSLAAAAVPALLRDVPTRGAPVLLGASLGALAAFHAEWTHPGTFAGLFLASGSFFQVRLDEHEHTFSRFWRIVSAVDQVLDAPEAPSRPPVVLVCGTAEENAANNTAFARALQRLHYPTALRPFRDGHTWVGWRDSLDPHLTALLEQVWGGWDH